MVPLEAYSRTICKWVLIFVSRQANLKPSLWPSDRNRGSRLRAAWATWIQGPTWAFSQSTIGLAVNIRWVLMICPGYNLTWTQGCTENGCFATIGPQSMHVCSYRMAIFYSLPRNRNQQHMVVFSSDCHSNLIQAIWGYWCHRSSLLPSLRNVVFLNYVWESFWHDVAELSSYPGHSYISILNTCLGTLRLCR